MLQKVCMDKKLLLNLFHIAIKFCIKGQGDAGNREQILPGARRRQPVFARNARRANEPLDEDDEEAGADLQLPEGKIGAKKMAKLQAKAEKKAMREVINFLFFTH